MNYLAILKLLGLLLMTLGASMLPSLGWSLYYGDGAWPAFVEAMAAASVLGGLMFLVGRLRNQDLYRREATAVVGLGWVACALAGALPFYFAGAFDNFIDCFFESMSGFTTTGASVLTDYEAMAPSLHFWRCFTHWLGGMGIIVLFVALLPFLGGSGKALMRSEVPGPVTETLTPRVKDTAIQLWKIYCIFTVAETALLMLFGMSLFDALCHTFATLATGGFSTHPASIAGFDNLGIELTIVVFMLAAGTNFSLFYAFLRGRRGALLRDPEWRAYLGIVAVATLLVTLSLMRSGVYSGLAETLRYGLFQVVTLMTTTGFATADFNLWPPAAKCVLVTLMFVGGSAGSTGGGLKVLRCLVLAKIALHQLEHGYSPRTVRKLRLSHQVLDQELQRGVLAFFFIWIAVFALGCFLLGLLEGPAGGGTANADVQLITLVTAVVATLNNIGPGLGMVGAVENYAFFQPASKLLLTFFMVLGRLELFSILVLLVPRFWGRR